MSLDDFVITVFCIEMRALPFSMPTAVGMIPNAFGRHVGFEMVC